MNGERFRHFQSDSRRQDLVACFHLLETEALCGEPLDPENDPRLAPAGRRGTDSPLLRSRQVTSRLNQARAHSDWLFVEMLSETLTILDFKSNRADFFFNRGSGPEAGERSIGPAMLALFMPHFSAMLLHASAVVRKGKTAVFLAPDEGGKTTAARNSPEGTILCDDQVLVRQTHGGFQASGTPWGLYCNSKLQAPLSGLFLLEKSGHFALNPLPPKELSRYLWEEHKNQLAILPPPLQAKAREITVAISNSVPSWKLSFSKDAIDWEAIDNAMAP